jgi:aryl-alcohol dehydrogenase-like predicted oxidoreductase
MRALDDAVRAGKILYVGSSDTPAWVVARGNTLADWHQWSPYIGLQLEYSLLERTIEREYFTLSKALNLSIAAWSPLAMGMLTGKYNLKASNDSRFVINKDWSSRYFTDRNFAIVDTLLQISKEIGKSPAQISLNWIRQNKNVSIIPIVGAKKVEQLKDSLGCLDFKLSEEVINRLDEASQIDLGFPQGFLRSDSLKQLLFGEVDYHIETI